MKKDTLKIRLYVCYSISQRGILLGLVAHRDRNCPSCTGLSMVSVEGELALVLAQEALCRDCR